LYSSELGLDRSDLYSSLFPELAFLRRNMVCHFNSGKNLKDKLSLFFAPINLSTKSQHYLFLALGESEFYCGWIWIVY
jgi:hypothetical protein